MMGFEMIVSKKVETFVDRFYCDECNVELTQSDDIKPTYPTVFDYTCPKCNKEFSSHTCYPTTRLEEIQDNNGSEVTKNNSLDIRTVQEFLLAYRK
jgi:hypothetical protein